MVLLIQETQHELDTVEGDMEVNHELTAKLDEYVEGLYFISLMAFTLSFLAFPTTHSTFVFCLCVCIILIEFKVVIREHF